MSDFDRIFQKTISYFSTLSVDYQDRNEHLIIKLMEFLKSESLNLQHKESDALMVLMDFSMLEYEEGNIEKTALAFYELGKQVGHLEECLRGLHSFEALSKAVLAEHARQAPLIMKSKKAEVIQEYIQNLASQLWLEEEHKGLRIADMAQLAWNKAHANHSTEEEKELIALLPDKPNGLIPWLRKVAPAEARKAGRPKNK